MNHTNSLWREGRLEEAEAMAREALALAERIGGADEWASAVVALANVLDERGEPRSFKAFGVCGMPLPHHRPLRSRSRPLRWPSDSALPWSTHRSLEGT